ncbi:MAG: ADP-ribosylation factor-like protein, partial [Fervidicoccaceae archaeon]|nr:ADP-ribosylation factor-like protein [Fervidicoccaceae archaeon]
ELILIDTVGFVFNAPPEIIEAFKSTLEEISDSDGIIMIVDASEQIDYIHLKLREAEKILNRLNSSHKPTLIFFNKMDLVTNENHLSSLRELCNNKDKFMISISECEFGSAFSIEDVEKALNKIINKLTFPE